MGYNFFDHEADLGIEVEGKTLSEIFKEAFLALFSVITDVEKVEERVEKDIEVKDGENLLIFFLNELLYLFEVEKFIPKSAQLNVREDGLYGRLLGDTFDEGRHEIKKLVKAATFHNFSLQNDGELFKVRFIIDI